VSGVRSPHLERLRAGPLAARIRCRPWLVGAVGDREPAAVRIEDGQRPGPAKSAGNGHAEVVHSPELLDQLGLHGLLIGGEVTIELDGDLAYTTGCEVLQLD